MQTRTLKKISIIARTIKAALGMAIPILFIGSITVLLNGFPVQSYQDFIDTFLDGALRNIISVIQVTTVGILAVYITAALNFSYVNLTDEGSRPVFRFGSFMACLTGFFIFVGFFTGERDLSLLSGQGVFSAMVAGLAGSALFRKFGSYFNTRKMIFVDGADSEFNASLHIVLPFLSVTLVFAVINYLITVIFRVQSVQHLFMKVVDAVFIHMHRSYFSGLLFITLASIMWCFGIHGNNVLNQVAEDMFTEIISGEIVSKSFIDAFVNMGGTGCTIGLLIAMIIFGRRSSTRKLSGMAFLPGVFNIGELLVFGFPIIYNPMMAVPFILAPMLCFTNAYVLTKTGFMPPVTNSVVWTTPALMSGYIATGSVRGILGQLFNILISAACYAPFVIMYEKKSLEDYSSAIDDLMAVVKKSGEISDQIVLTDYDGNVGRLAKHLAMDLEVALDASLPDADTDKAENPLVVDQQLQYDDSGRCTGAESLLKWDHKRYGEINTPLVIKIAGESGDLYDLETYYIERSVRDSADLRKKYGESFILNVSVTLSTFTDKRFIPFLQQTADRYMLRAGNICLKITGKDVPAADAGINGLMEEIRVYGYTSASDYSIGG